jgi:D-serine deaminase-like pyridoxal phosphate-dependent protein
VIRLIPGDAQPWLDPSTYWPSLTEATAELDPVFGVVSLPALSHNAFALLGRTDGMPIRVATKSVRSRPIIDAVLALPGYAGALAFTLPEALWLAADTPERAGIRDVVVGYPTVNRAAIRALATSPQLAERVTIMVDGVEQLDIVDAAIPPHARRAVRVCLELDSGWDSRLVGFTGVRRSPLHSPAQLRALAEIVVSRPGFRLVGVMAYESQIAGQVNQPVGRPLYGRTVRWMQRQSTSELAARRAEAIAAVREVADLEFVNGGGTGSLESTSADRSVTDVAAGSGLFGPHLFDHYSHFSPAPAAAFALPVVRKPAPEFATLLGGGWIASGPAGKDRLPKLVWPEGLRYLPREQAGEVQTPVSGPGARALVPGDRVWARHTKAGELAEHVDELVLVDGGAVVGTALTYRGEGKVFL